MAEPVSLPCDAPSRNNQPWLGQDDWAAGILISSLATGFSSFVCSGCPLEVEAGGVRTAGSGSSHCPGVQAFALFPVRTIFHPVGHVLVSVSSWALGLYHFEAV